MECTQIHQLLHARTQVFNRVKCRYLQKVVDNGVDRVFYQFIESINELARKIIHSEKLTSNMKTLHICKIPAQSSNESAVITHNDPDLGIPVERRNRDCAELPIQYSNSLTLTTMQTIQLFSKSQACATARQNSYMFRQGSQWIVSAFSDKTGSWDQSSAMNFYRARTVLAIARINIACEMLGWPSGDQAYLDRNPADNSSWTAYVQPGIQTTY